MPTPWHLRQTHRMAGYGLFIQRHPVHPYRNQVWEEVSLAIRILIYEILRGDA